MTDDGTRIVPERPSSSVVCSGGGKVAPNTEKSMHVNCSENKTFETPDNNTRMYPCQFQRKTD